MMQQLPQQTVRLLSSAQVITSVLNAVKELLENALDSGADSVEVKLENFGLDKIEVRDNGSGISSNDVPLMGQRHYTSKLKDFTDLTTVTSYGFRGEALASLCAISDVSITTKQEEDSISRVHTLSHSGLITSSKPSHLGNGTTVTVTNLFQRVPVRRQYYSSSNRKKEEIKKMEDLVMCYGYINPTVRFTLSHNKKLLWQKNKVSSCKIALLNTVGSNVMSQMEAVEHQDIDTGVTLSGFLPKAGCDLQLVGRVHSNDRCWIYINKRPVHFKEAERMLKQSFMQSLSNGMTTVRYLTACLHFMVPIETVDVNLEPDKRKVLLQNKDAVLLIFAQTLNDFYKKNDRKTDVESGNDALPRLEDDTETQTRVDVACIDKDEGILDSDNILQNGTNLDDDHISETHHEHSKNSHEVREQASFSLYDDGIFTDSQVPVGCEVTEEMHLSCKEVGREDDKEQSDAKNVEDDSSFGVGAALGHSKSGADSLQPDMRVLENLEAKTDSSVPTDLINAGVISISEWSKGITLGTNANPVEPVTLLLPSNDGNIGKENVADDYREDGQYNAVNLGNVGVMGRRNSTLSDTLSNNLGPPLPSLPNMNNTEGSSEHDKHLTTLPKDILNPVDANVQRSEKNITNGIRDHVPSRSRSTFDLVHGSPVRRPESAFLHFVKEYAPKLSECIPAIEKDSLNILLKETWKGFPQDKRQAYQGLAEKDQQRYNKHLLGSTTNGKQVTSQQANPTKRKKLAKGAPPVSNQGLIDQMLASQENKQKHSTKVKSIVRTKEVAFSVSCLRKCNEGYVNTKDEENLRLLCELPPHHYWIMLQDSKLVLFNHFRAEEMLLFKRLMASHSLPSSNLEIPIPLSESMVGSMNNWLSLLSLKCTQSEISNTSCCEDERLTSNGFNLRRIIDQERKSIHFQIIGMADSIPCYSMTDLIEILDKISESPGVNLNSCRPLKVTNYLKGEAVRIGRSRPDILSQDEVMELIESLKGSTNDPMSICLHDKPIFHELCSLEKPHRTIIPL